MSPAVAALSLRPAPPLGRAAQVGETRRALEAVLDSAGWPWSPSLSLVLDWLVSIEENGR